MIPSRPPSSDGTLGPRPRGASLAAALGGLLLASCIFDDRTAGTSTTVTNPATAVYGEAILLDGRPAVGARVELRTTGYRVTPAGKPEAILFASDTVDDTGGFRMPIPPLMKEHYLVMHQAPVAGSPAPEESLEVQLRRWQDGVPVQGYMGALRLDRPGDAAGVLVSGDTSADSARWIGDRGTANFAKVAADGSFRLARLAPGTHHLVVVTVPVTDALPDSLAFGLREFVATVEIGAGMTTDVGRIIYNDS